MIHGTVYNTNYINGSNCSFCRLGGGGCSGYLRNCFPDLSVFRLAGPSQRAAMVSLRLIPVVLVCLSPRILKLWWSSSLSVLGLLDVWETLM